MAHENRPQILESKHVLVMKRSSLSAFTLIELVGRHCDYRDPGGLAFPAFAGPKRRCSRNGLPEQRPPDRGGSGLLTDETMREFFRVPSTRANRGWPTLIPYGGTKGTYRCPIDKSTNRSLQLCDQRFSLAAGSRQP